MVTAGHFGQVIRTWREGGGTGKRLTRKVLAKKIGRCDTTIRNWERGHPGQEPRMRDLVQMEKAKPGLICMLFPTARHRYELLEHGPLPRLTKAEAARARVLRSRAHRDRLARKHPRKPG
jgi:hypothetical protein